MEIFPYTLVSDGPSDANLIPILKWVLRERGGLPLSQGIRADFWKLPLPPGSLAEKIRTAADLYPCRLLFVHRDAEKQAASCRYKEIRDAIEGLADNGFQIPAVAVVPVRMLEAWFLLDESAIRYAVGNPNGRQPLNIPHPRLVEDRPDPKSDLQHALREACGLKGRRLKKFSVGRAFWRITDYLEDFAVLRQLPAFRELEGAVERMAQNGYAPGFYGLQA